MNSSTTLRTAALPLSGLTVTFKLEPSPLPNCAKFRQKKNVIKRLNLKLTVITTDPSHVSPSPNSHLPTLTSRLEHFGIWDEVASFPTISWVRLF